MSNLHFNSSHIQPVTAIPSLFFDTYMPEASGEFLKVYLYLYRWQSDCTKSISLADIADNTYMTDRDVMRALRYWQSKGLLKLSLDADQNLTGITMLPIKAPQNGSSLGTAMPADGRLNPTGDPVIPTAGSDVAPADGRGAASEGITPAKGTVLSAEDRHSAASDGAFAASGGTSPATGFVKPQYTMDQIAEFSKENQGDQLFFVIQHYVGHPLSHTEINTIVFFHEVLGFSTDLIEYLFEYCVSNNHRSIYYIEKVAISWAEDGVDTVSKAKLRSSYFSKTHFAVLRAFGISGRNPSSVEADYINRWTDEYGFSSSLIVEACNRTMASTHSPNFKYADGILKSWRDHKAFTLNEVRALDAAHEKGKKTAAGSKPPAAEGRTAGKPKKVNSFNSFNQRTYDYEDLEQKLARKIQTATESG